MLERSRRLNSNALAQTNIYNFYSNSLIFLQGSRAKTSLFPNIMHKVKAWSCWTCLCYSISLQCWTSKQDSWL